METNDIKIVEIFVMVIFTSIGLIGGAIKFIINPYFNAKLETIKKENEIEISKIKGSIDIKIELEKHKLKNTEIYFQKQLEAMKELYKLRTNILPEYRMPDMEWDDACLDIAQEFTEIEEKIENFLVEYFSIISQSIVSNLTIAKNCAAQGKFLNISDLQNYTLADTLWKRVDEATEDLKQHIQQQINNQNSQ